MAVDVLLIMAAEVLQNIESIIKSKPLSDNSTTSYTNPKKTIEVDPNTPSQLKGHDGC